MKGWHYALITAAALGVAWALSRRQQTTVIYEARKGTLEQIGALAQGVGEGAGAVLGPLLPWLDSSGNNNPGSSSSGG